MSLIISASSVILIRVTLDQEPIPGTLIAQGWSLSITAHHTHTHRKNVQCRLSTYSMLWRGRRKLDNLEEIIHMLCENMKLHTDSSPSVKL